MFAFTYINQVVTFIEIFQIKWNAVISNMRGTVSPSIRQYGHKHALVTTTKDEIGGVITVETYRYETSYVA